MTDELSIQAQQPQRTSPMPYVLGGAAVGAAAGGATGYYTTKPQYSNFQELIDEKQDTFDSKVKDAAEDQKKVWEKAKEARQAGIDAGKDYDTRLEAYKEANKAGATPELPAGHELIKERNQITNTIKEIEANPKTVEVGTRTAQPLAELRQSTKELNKAAEELKQLKANGASEDAIKAVQVRIDKQQARLNAAYDKIMEKVKFRKTKTFKCTEAEIKAAKEELRLQLEGYPQEYMTAYDKFAAKAPVKAHIKAQEAITKANENIETSLAKIEEVSGYQVKDAFNEEAKRIDILKDKLKAQGLNGAALETKLEKEVLKGTNGFERRINVIKKIEQNKVDKLKKLSAEYNKISDRAGKLSFWDRIENILSLANGGEAIHKPSTSDKELAEFAKSLTDKEKAMLGNKELGKETFSELIKNAENRLNTITNAANDIASSQQIIKTTNRDIRKLLKEAEKKYGGKGKNVHFNKAGEICVNGKPVEKAATFKCPEFKAGEHVIFPKEIEVGTSAKKVVDEKALQEAKDKLKDVEAKITEARNALPKCEAKTAEELTKEFVEKNGSREDAIKKAGESFKDDLKNLFEKKVSNKKLAAWIAGGAVALGALGYIFAPKNDQA